MGFFDRSRPADDKWGRTYEGQATEPSGDQQALARYRYMLKTAPPETIEQAHAEAFSRLTPQQRRMLLEQLRAEMPDSERAFANDSAPVLARLATREEVRRPGTMERLFGSAPAAVPGFGGMVAGGLLGSLAGTVLGTMVAQNFLGGHGHGLAGGDMTRGVDGSVRDADAARDVRADTDDDIGGIDDVGGDFDGGSFDV